MATGDLNQTMPRRRLRSIISGYVMIIPALLLVVFVIIYPATRSILLTLTTKVDGTTTGFTLEQYTNFFSDPFSVNNLLYTLQVTITVVVVLFMIAFPVCLYLRFSKSKIANLIHFLTLFPLFVPGIVLAYAMIRFTITHGLFASILASLGIAHYNSPYPHTEGTIIGLVWEGIPFTTLILSAAMIQIDDSLLESARDVGANNWQIFTRIMLPLMKNAVVIIFSLQFLGVLGSYTIPYLLGPASARNDGGIYEPYLHARRCPY